MSTVTFVLGLAGSGKSHYVANLVANKRFEENFATEGCHDAFHADLVDRLLRGEHCTVSELQYLDPELRDEYVRKLRAAIGESLTINWICFDNDLATANSNCSTRLAKDWDPTGDGHIAINNAWTNRYVSPKGATILPIHDLRGSCQCGRCDS
jgi:hypothetical protein